MGTFAVKCCIDNMMNIMVAEAQEKPIAVPIEKSWLEKKELNDYTVDILNKITLLG
jgi:hypothetical protein